MRITSLVVTPITGSARDLTLLEKQQKEHIVGEVVKNVTGTMPDLDLPKVSGEPSDLNLKACSAVAFTITIATTMTG